MDLEALQPVCYTYLDSFELITGVTVVSSRRLKDMEKS